MQCPCLFTNCFHEVLRVELLRGEMNIERINDDKKRIKNE